MMKKILSVFILSLLVTGSVAFADNTTINPLSPWIATTTPVNGMTQRVYGQAIQITGLTTGLCLTLDGNHQLTTTSCGSGGGGTFPFTSNVGYNSTTTALGLLGGVFSTASSTFSSNLYLSNLTQGFSYIGTNGLVGTVSTSTLANYILPFTSYGASTSTIIGFKNGLFSTASSTFSSNLFFPSLSQGSLYTGSNGLVQTTATGTVTCTGSASCGAGSYVLGNNLVINATGGAAASAFEIATDTAITAPGFAYFEKTSGRTTLGSISTSTLANYILPFTSYGASTSTVIGLTGGYFSTASSTQSGNLFLPALTQGFVYTGSNGLVQTTATTTLPGGNPQVPSGTVNGDTTAFSVTGNISNVYVNGQLEQSGTDYIYTAGAFGTITFAIAPPTGSILFAN